MDTYVLAS